MKKLLLLAPLCIAMALSNNVKAQILSGGKSGKDSTLPKIDLGVKIGTNIQSIHGDIWDNGYQAGILGGFFARMHKNKFGGRVEVLVSTFKLISSTLTDSVHADSKGNFMATYLNVPVMLEYDIIPNLMVQAGVQYSNLMAVKSQNISGDIKGFFKQGEFSAVLGLEVKLPKNLDLGARYRYGFSNVNDEVISEIPGSWTTQAIQVYAGYTIPHKN